MSPDVIEKIKRSNKITKEDVDRLTDADRLKTSRDATNTLPRNPGKINKTERVDCNECKHLTKIITELKDDYSHELNQAQQKNLELKQVLNDIKKNLVMGKDEEIDFELNSNANLNLSNFALKVQLLYRKMYAELVKSRNFNSKLVKN